MKKCYLIENKDNLSIIAIAPWSSERGALQVQDQDGQGIPGQKGKEPTLSKSDFAFENKTSNSTFVMGPFFDVSLTKGTH